MSAEFSNADLGVPLLIKDQFECLINIKIIVALDDGEFASL